MSDKCTICGRELKEFAYITAVKHDEGGYLSSAWSVDACPECFKKITEFIGKFRHQERYDFLGAIGASLKMLRLATEELLGR